MHRNAVLLLIAAIGYSSVAAAANDRKLEMRSTSYVARPIPEMLLAGSRKSNSPSSMKAKSSSSMKALGASRIGAVGDRTRAPVSHRTSAVVAPKAARPYQQPAEARSLSARPSAAVIAHAQVRMSSSQGLLARARNAKLALASAAAGTAKPNVSRVSLSLPGRRTLQMIRASKAKAASGGTRAGVTPKSHGVSTAHLRQIPRPSPAALRAILSQ